jgi:release factor glutamine methyltransferase
MSTPDEPWTIGRLLVWTVEYLKKHGAENPRLDAEVLLAAARGCQRIDLYASYGDEASDELRAQFREFVARRAQCEPVAYIVGRKEFYSLDFEVTRDTLIPRPETEMLVVALLDEAQKRGAGGREQGAAKVRILQQESVVRGSPDPALPTTEGLPPNAPSAPSSSQPLSSSLSLADIGTGSGILAVCATKYLPTATVTAIDSSPAALAVARRNAERHEVANRISFIESDLFAAVPAGQQFDIIVSNPPYIRTAEMAVLPPDVRNFEPQIALEAGPTGTEIVARLVAQATNRLGPGGVLFLEISPMIADAVEQLVRTESSLELGPTLRDSAGHARVVQAVRQ